VPYTRFQSNPKESHFTAAKRIMKYLQGTINIGLWYLADVSLNLVGYCDNTSVINLTKNPVQHSRTKHIEICHHFIRDHVTNGDCEIQFVSTENQLADLFTKPLSKERFNFLTNELGILDIKHVL